MAVCFGAVAALAPARAQTLTTAETGRFTGPDRTARLIAGAKKEGSLTLYSSAQVAVMTAVGNAFEKKYGVKVNLWRGSSEQIFQRVQAEARAGRFVVDVMETAGPTMEAGNRVGLLQDIVTPVTAELMPEAYVPGRPWIVSRLSVFTIAYNTKLVRKADIPSSYDGFLDPKWKGKLAIEADDNNWLMAVDECARRGARGQASARHRGEERHIGAQGPLADGQSRGLGRSAGRADRLCR